MSANVSTTSLDHDAMKPYWAKVDAVLGGVATMRKQESFLPKYPNESQSDYDFRRDNSKFTNVFDDIIENLASKPFAKKVAVEKIENSKTVVFMDDVDGEGSHIHAFAGELLYNALSDAIQWVLIDFTKTESALRTVAEEKAAGVRPYWVNIKAQDMIAVRSTKIDGREQFTHCRFNENRVEVDGYGETVIERIREFNRFKDDKTGLYMLPTWQVWEKDGSDWNEVDSGTLSIDEIPLVPFFTGRRKGSSWQFKPLLTAALDLQIEVYQDENGLKYAKANAAFPMLAGNGVTPEVDDNGIPKQAPVGPKTCLYAPMGADGDHGEWTFIEPAATSLAFLAGDIKETIMQLRELGRQPLTAQSGNLTVVTTTFAAQKGNSAIMASAIMLEEALEAMIVLTGKWIGETLKPSVDVYKDFEINALGDESVESLLKMRDKGDISQSTLWLEMKRRKILNDRFDEKDELKKLNEELPSEDDDDEDKIISLVEPVA